MYKYGGISANQFNADVEKDFTKTYDGTLIENTPFTVYLTDKEVQVYLYIEDLDMAEYEYNTDHVITVGIVPAFNSLTKNRQDNILSQFDETTRENFKSNEIGLVHESLLYGYGIPLRSETVSVDDAEDTMKSAIAVRGGITGLIGFELDRYQNRIGNTGWDYLSEYCEDKGLIKMALGR